MPLDLCKIAPIHAKSVFAPALIATVMAGSSCLAGDFSNPAPFTLSADSGMRAALENTRLNLNARLGTSMSSYYQLGDYYERYQATENWMNPSLSGNTIILNGDNNTVTFSVADDATVTQTATDVCLSGSGTIVEGTESTTTTDVDCGD